MEKKEEGMSFNDIISDTNKQGSDSQQDKIKKARMTQRFQTADQLAEEDVPDFLKNIPKDQI
jgi:hypothetical protein